MPAAASPSDYPRHPTNANLTVRAARGGRILLPRPHVVDRPHRIEGAERGSDRPFETEWRSRPCAPPAGNTRREHPAPCATEAAIPGCVNLSIRADITRHSGHLRAGFGRIATAETAGVRRLDPGREIMCRHRIRWATLAKGGWQNGPGCRPDGHLRAGSSAGPSIGSKPIGSPSAASHSAAAGPGLGRSARSRTNRAASHWRRVVASTPGTPRR